MRIDTLSQANEFYNVNINSKTNKEFLLLQINPDDDGFKVYSKSNQITPLQKHRDKFLKTFPNAKFKIVANK